MSLRRELCVTLLTVLACGGSAMSLTPQEVLVVGNAKDADSADLAKYYANARGIPSENVVLINTTTAYQVSRKDYESQILQPLRQFLLQRDLAAKVRCIVLMWRVPVRVAGPPLDSDTSGGVYQRAATKAHYRLAIDHKLLGSVGRKFPTPATDGLKPIGKLFASPVPEPSKPLMKLDDLKKDLKTLLVMKELQIEKIDDPAKRSVASRQLMALYLDLYGLRGLIDHVKQSKPDHAPNTDDLQQQLNEADHKLNDLRAAKPTAETTKAMLAMMKETDGIVLVSSYAQKHIKKKSKATKGDASVDSELALLWWGKYKLEGPMINALHWRSSGRFKGRNIPPVIMTARIDGPTRADARRIIKASLSTEKTGLEGNFYIDAGGKVPKYDEHLRRLYEFVLAETKIPAVMDSKKTVFVKDSCPRAALYVGWYSLRRYVPAFMWTPGSVGWHIASFEAMELRNPNSQQWCPKMIQNGVAATIGAVNEPYLGSFPLPEEFFPLLMTGQYTLAECYWRTSPTVSWRMTLIGDPLYKPFAANPQIDPSTLPPALLP